MKYFHFIVITAFAFFLTACGSNPTVPPEYKYVLVKPPANLLLNCEKEAPPSKESYKTVETEHRGEMVNILSAREDMLTKVLLKQYKNTDVCNSRLTELRNWVTKQEQLYKAAIPKPKEE